MTVPRSLSPLLRTRRRRALTATVAAAALLAAGLPLWPRSPEPAPAPRAAAPAPRDEPTAVAEAAATGKDVLVETATTPTSQTWALANGTMRTETTAVPTRARTATGTWAAINTDLVRDEGPLGIHPVNAVSPVRFAAGGTTGAESVLAEAEVGEHTISYIWPGPLPEAVIDGNRALYPEVVPGADLLITARDQGGFANLVIVKTPEAPVHDLRYVLRSRSAVFKADRSTGGVQVLDRAGREVTVIPTPFGWDSSAEDPDAPGRAPLTSVATDADVLRLTGLNGIEPGARSAQLPLALDGDGSGDATLHLDVAASGLLSDPAAHYPLFLDPTMAGTWLGWTLVSKQHPNSNFFNGTKFNSGTTTEARVGHEDDTGMTARSFWRMDFDPKIKGATIESASFKINNTHSWSCDTRQFQLWLTGPISTSTTWNKQPAWKTNPDYAAKSFAFGRPECPDDYVSFNTTAHAQAAADSGSDTLTVGMRAASEDSTYSWRKFAAKSAELTVVYNRKPDEPTGGKSTPGGACSTTGVTIGRTDLVLWAKSKDDDGNLKSLRFRFWKLNGAVPAGTVKTVSSKDGSASVTIASEDLADKATYLWDVRAEDDEGLVSTFFPAGTDSCKLTIDASAPAEPTVTSVDFPAATDDGTTWSAKPFGTAGSITFTAKTATRFTYSFEGYTAVTKTGTDTVTVTDLKPPHSGPINLTVRAYDAAGNASPAATYTFYVSPRSAADGPADVTGDGLPDLVGITGTGTLRTYPGDPNGDLQTSLAAGYTSGNELDPTGHWTDTAGTGALITKYGDTYPGDGITDLFARTPDGEFWLYPGDGYGSFNVDRRISVLLPANTPAPATWTRIRAVGDVDGDGLTDLFLQSGAGFWALLGYTGASFGQAVQMWDSGWERRDLITVDDIDQDGTPDLLFRSLDNGTMFVRHGKPGTVAGSVDLASLKNSGASRQGDTSYGTLWDDTRVTDVVSIPDRTGDGVPELWARSALDGQIRYYTPTTTAAGGTVKVVLTSDLSTYKTIA